MYFCDVADVLGALMHVCLLQVWQAISNPTSNLESHFLSSLVIGSLFAVIGRFIGSTWCTSRGMSEPKAVLIGAASPASEDGTAPTRRGGCGLDLGSVHRFCEARDCWLLWRQSMHTAERQAVHVHRWHGTRPGLEPTSSGSIPVRVSTPRRSRSMHTTCN